MHLIRCNGYNPVLVIDILIGIKLLQRHYDLPIVLMRLLHQFFRKCRIQHKSLRYNSNKTSKRPTSIEYHRKNAAVGCIVTTSGTSDFYQTVSNNTYHHTPLICLESRKAPDPKQYTQTRNGLPTSRHDE